VLSLLSSPLTGLLALLSGLLSLPVYYFVYRRAPEPKQERSLGIYLVAALGVGLIGFVTGMALGIFAACFTDDAGNLCGLAGVFGTGPLLAALAMIVYAHLWARSARRTPTHPPVPDTMSVDGVYSGTIEAGKQDYGGSARLVLGNGRFELQMTRSYPYSIEDGQTLSGTYAADGEDIAFTSEEFISYTEETVRQEHRESRTMHFTARFGQAREPSGPRPIVITLRLLGVWPLELHVWPVT
jgi:hypothetical protein